MPFKNALPRSQSKSRHEAPKEVSTEDEDGSSLDEETATQLFIVTLAMISLMNRAIEA